MSSLDAEDESATQAAPRKAAASLRPKGRQETQAASLYAPAVPTVTAKEGGSNLGSRGTSMASRRNDNQQLDQRQQVDVLNRLDELSTEQQARLLRTTIMMMLPDVGISKTNSNDPSNE